MASDEDVRILKAEVKRLSEQVTEHRVRLENGVHAFRDVRTMVDVIDRRTQPRHVSTPRVVGVTLAIVMAGATALWGLSGILHTKTDEAQVEAIYDRKSRESDVIHRTHELSIQALKDAQGRQEKRFQAIETKLDTVISRLPASKKSPSRRRR